MTDDIAKQIAMILATSDLSESEALTILDALEKTLLDAFDKTIKTANQYLTRGGFIKDRNGRWCKEGDKIKVEIRDNFQGCWVEAILKYSDDTFSFHFEFIDKEVQEYLPSAVDVTDDYEFELIEPCEPDICKDFKDAGADK